MNQGRVKMDESGYGCVICTKSIRKGSWAVQRRFAWLHPQCVPVSDPAPTVEPVDDVAESRCEDADCVCGGVDDEAEEDMAEKGPWFGAMYDGRCYICYRSISEGDRIRSDGQGGYECESCGYDDREEGDEPGRSPLLNAPTADEFLAVRESQLSNLPTADEFLDPTAPDPDPRLNVSGQPTDESKFRDYLGRYAIKDPATGDFRRFKNGKVKGITRVTTFNKAAGNSKAINDWNRRNIVIGASLRGDLVIEARGMTHEQNRDDLDRIAGQLEVAAGSKVASAIGTDVHEITERIDAGVLAIDDAPVQYRDQLELYVKELADAGFEAVPGMIERVTAITEYGGVAGTFDRLYFHRPSGRYLIGDVKTGKTMKYAMSETECQEWVYAHGINQNGVYDLNAHEWEEPHTLADVNERMVVDETEGLVIHMPVQGPLAGQVRLLKADLTSGRAYADLCADVKGWEPSKEVLWSWEPAQPAGDPAIDWDDAFSHVVSDEQATEYWRRAKAAGIKGVELNRLIELARLSLARYKG